MRYPKCNDKCRPEEGLHWLGDKWCDENKPLKCCGCGAVGVPHYGFSSPCFASTSGGHYLTEEQARINANSFTFGEIDDFSDEN